MARLWTYEQVTHLMALAYDSGVYQERRRVAEAWEEIDAVRARHPVEHHTYEQQVADRVAQMEEAARQEKRRLGLPERPEYAGGPVDWETGEPVTPPTPQRRPGWLRDHLAGRRNQVAWPAPESKRAVRMRDPAGV